MTTGSMPTTASTPMTQTTPGTPSTPSTYELFRDAEQYLADGHPRHAISTLERIEDADEAGSPAVRRLLALACYRFASLERARRLAQTLVDDDPSDAEAAHLLGRTLTRQGRPDEARHWLRLAAVLDPREEHTAYADDAVAITT